MNPIRQRIANFLKQEYDKTLTEEGEKKKPSMSQMAGKLLVMFFAAMLLFTIISRVTASITVAQITVTNPNSDFLYFKVKGTGTIRTSEAEHIKVKPGYRISKIYISPGQKVEEGEVLFQYDTEELQEQYDAVDLEIQKLKLQIEQSGIGTVTSFLPSANLSKLSLDQAVENLKAAKLKQKDAKVEYQEESEKTKAELLKDKQKEYKEAAKEYDNYVRGYQKELLTATRAVNDSKKAVEKAREIPEKINQSIDTYISAIWGSDSQALIDAKEAVFVVFYGSKEAYNNHVNDMEEAELAVARANSDYGNENSSMNERALEDAIRQRKKIEKKDDKLMEYLLAYQYALGETSDAAAVARNDLYNYILGDRKEATEKETADTELMLTRAQEDFDLLINEDKQNKADFEAKLLEIDEIIKSMEEGTFNYQEYLETLKQTVKTAEEAVHNAEQTVAFQQASYKNAKDSDAATITANNKNTQIAELTVQSYNLDLEGKEKELASLQEMIHTSGDIKSPYSGIVTSIGIEEGKKTTGEEIIKIGFGDFIFQAEVEKENLKYVKAGDEVSIQLRGDNNSIQTEIDDIASNSEGMAVITAIMPEEDYLLEETAGFEVVNQSDSYSMCIPLQALHKDNNGYYILTVKEQKGILGTELAAYRVNVELIEKDNSKAAVKGSLSLEDDVIVESSKAINTDDRVRLK